MSQQNGVECAPLKDSNPTDRTHARAPDSRYIYKTHRTSARPRILPEDSRSSRTRCSISSVPPRSIPESWRSPRRYSRSPSIPIVPSIRARRRPSRFGPIFFPSLNSTLKSKVSLTVMCGKKVTSCSMNAEGSWESPATGAPLTYLEPCRRTLEESLIRPARAWTRVDFPEPDGPIMASILPGRAFPRMDPSNMIRSSFFFFFCFNVMRMSEKPISTFLRNPRSMRASSSMTISSSSSSSSSCAPNFTTSLRGCDD
mmetsp:Transcript_23137/g.68259  ORF Transcript_23137/g.68259 Transcript_23137/m.68259 type:complete len:256 (-) Transcript_23137:824-1591(-)